MKNKIRIFILITIIFLSLYIIFSIKNLNVSKILYVIDTSYSMGTTENGITRLQKAKNLILENNTKYISVYTFGQQILPIFPLSENKNLLQKILSNLKIDNTFTQTQDIGTALEKSILEAKNKNIKNIYLLSDGGVGDILISNNLNNLLKNNDLNIYIIGIGDLKATNLSLVDTSGQSRQVKDNSGFVMTSLNRKGLENFTKKLGIKYIENKNPDIIGNKFTIIFSFLIIVYLGTYLKFSKK